MLEKEETFAQLRTLLHQMPQPDREILTLRYALDYNTGQISDLLMDVGNKTDSHVPTTFLT